MNDPYMRKARQVVYDYVKGHLEKSEDAVSFLSEDVYIVWFSKTLQNWKALVSTSLPDGMYYEVTHNGDKRETYLDAYRKVENVVIPDDNEDRIQELKMRLTKAP